MDSDGFLFGYNGYTKKYEWEEFFGASDSDRKLPNTHIWLEQKKQEKHIFLGKVEDSLFNRTFSRFE